jgi:hypothetical protein
MGEHLIRHAGAGPASIKELAVIGVIAEQERAEVPAANDRNGGKADVRLSVVDARRLSRTPIVR